MKKDLGTSLLAFFTFLLFLATVWMAWETRSAVQESVRARIAEDQHYQASHSGILAMAPGGRALIYFMDRHGVRHAALQAYLRNIGFGPATNVDVDVLFADGTSIKWRLANMIPGEDFPDDWHTDRTFGGSVISSQRYPWFHGQSPTRLEVHYRTLFGTDRTTTYVLQKDSKDSTRSRVIWLLLEEDLHLERGQSETGRGSERNMNPELLIAIMTLIGAVVGAFASAASIIGVEWWRQRSAVERARDGAKNVLIGLLRNCSGFAYVGQQAIAPLPEESLKIWREHNSLLTATLANTGVMASLGGNEASTLWNAANQGEIAIAMLTNMSKPGNPQAKFAPNVSASALNHYTKARSDLGDDVAADKLMEEMSRVSRGDTMIGV